MLNSNGGWAIGPRPALSPARGGADEMGMIGLHYAALARFVAFLEIPHRIKGLSGMRTGFPQGSQQKLWKTFAAENHTP